MVVGADDAVLVLSAPNPVTRKLLDRTGLSIGDFDAIECNEAFAAIALMWNKEFQPDADRYNARGGAIAIGHPLGASGVRIMGTLLNQLETTGGRLGFQTMCEGGGQANATVIERTRLRRSQWPLAKNRSRLAEYLEGPVPLEGDHPAPMSPTVRVRSRRSRSCMFPCRLSPFDSRTRARLPRR